RRCDQKYRLGLNPAWLSQAAMYFRSLANGRDHRLGWAAPLATEEHICNTYERNIMVDLYGVARLCFAPVFPGMRLSRYGDLRRFWEDADFIRARMRACNRLCGISHSVRREHATLATGAPAS
ncbi:MAG: radical SAM protein, partial [Burkholderiales bacterium]|nr:radical SAM protein [Burkholderiales bacterium]